MNSLDEASTYTVDAAGMFEHIERLGSEFEAAWRNSAGMPIPNGSFDKIVIAAMGGSAAAADYFSVWSEKESPVPVRVVRGYSLPAYVDEQTLLIALSYSGGTDEALACYAEAKFRGSQRLVISAGGELTRLATADGTLVHRIDYESPPRAAIGHSLAPLIRMGSRLGLVSMCDADIAAVAHAHSLLVHGHLGRAVPTETNPAKQIAAFVLEGAPIVIFGAEHLAPTARRARNQLAENAKLLALYEEVPEATHNIVEGLDKPVTGTPVGLSFDSPKLATGNRKRMEAVGRQFSEAGGELAGLPTRGVSRLADQFEASAWGDFISCYAALLRGIDPTPTPGLARMRTKVSADTAGQLA